MSALAAPGYTMALSLAPDFIKERRDLWTNPNGARSHTAYITIHHAAANYPAGRAADAIYAYHKQKWPDYHAAAYHEIIQIDAGGYLRCSIVNNPPLIGAGVADHNGDTFHICAATNFVGLPDPAWIEALAQRAAAARRRYPQATIVGHRDIARPGHSTECPGQLWPSWRPRLLARVDELLKPLLPAPPAPELRELRFRGWPIYQAQSLSGALAGHLAAGETIAIDRVYSNGGAHLADGRGFIDLNTDALEDVP